MTDAGKKTAAEASPPVRAPWLRLAAIALVVAAFGLPINQLVYYALLLIAAVLIFSGRLIRDARSWLAAAAAVAIAATLPLVLAPNLIAEGDNIFLPGPPGNVLQRALPDEVYDFMRTQFDALYPPSQRCKPGGGCWIGTGPERAFAFSADSIFGKPRYSRLVTGIDFSDPVWLRLGFINDVRYNWNTDAPDVHRADRNRQFWMGLRRWRVTMPWFVMYRFPAAYVGADLCWRGDVLWQGTGERFAVLHHAQSGCRRLDAADVGGRIFGVAIKPGTLSMTLHPPPAVQARLIGCGLARFVAIIAVLVLLVRVRLREVWRPFVLIGLALVVIAIDDASFIGGWRPMDGGDDGLFYTGMGRLILQHLLDGNFAAALAGGENVFYYGGPGLRYFRALEMIAFGDTNLGYLSFVLAMPVIVLGLFKRFLSDQFAWTLALVFTALPLGEVFGTSFFHYAKWAARGFADPLAHILLIWGLLVVIGRRDQPARNTASAAGGALLLSLAIFTKPAITPIAGIILGGAGLAALAQRQWPRLAGLCAGFLPFFLMPLHNWYFGHQFVLLSRNAKLPQLYVMPPSVYASALGDLLRLDFSGEYLRRALAHTVDWLSGPSGLWPFIPLQGAAVVVVGYVAFFGRGFDPWLRLTAAAVFAEYGVAAMYASAPRYFFGMWFLSALMVAVFIERRWPRFAGKIRVVQGP